ncbi:hypothetical protein JTE90_008156 [Oedothorax gibbosus]|uniref:Uncharacterized protein n=1 Tax=Oedothorax gibbosus TaxID=931172 RepID=A0AAV6VFX9_9ARAC|nr:hypothetical protein JTE90_008156 [Oedothorax gibbosus]
MHRIMTAPMLSALNNSSISQLPCTLYILEQPNVEYRYENPNLQKIPPQKQPPKSTPQQAGPLQQTPYNTHRLYSRLHPTSQRGPTNKIGPRNNAAPFFESCWAPGQFGPRSSPWGVGCQGVSPCFCESFMVSGSRAFA